MLSLSNLSMTSCQVNNPHIVRNFCDYTPRLSAPRLCGADFLLRLSRLLRLLVSGPTFAASLTLKKEASFWSKNGKIPHRGSNQPLKPEAKREAKTLPEATESHQRRFAIVVWCLYPQRKRAPQRRTEAFFLGGVSLEAQKKAPT